MIFHHFRMTKKHAKSRLAKTSYFEGSMKRNDYFHLSSPPISRIDFLLKFLVFSGTPPGPRFGVIIPEFYRKMRFGLPCWPSWGQNSDQHHPNFKKLTEFPARCAHFSAFLEPPSAPKFAKGNPKPARGTPSLIFNRFYKDFS